MDHLIEVEFNEEELKRAVEHLEDDLEVATTIGEVVDNEGLFEKAEVEIFDIIEYQKILENEENEKIKNIFKYGFQPSDQLAGLDDFCDRLEDKLKNRYDPYQKIDCNNKIINCVITYPLKKAVKVQLTCNVDITYGLLLYAYTSAYQIISSLEEQSGIFDMFHSIEELVYNGDSNVVITPSGIWCDFDCDS
jgi:hypothetical protein